MKLLETKFKAKIKNVGANLKLKPRVSCMKQTQISVPMMKRIAAHAETNQALENWCKVRIGSTWMSFLSINLYLPI